MSESSGAHFMFGCGDFEPDEHKRAEYVRIDAVPEPVAVIGSAFQLLYCRENWSEGLKVGMPLYTAPPPDSTNRLTDLHHEDWRELYNIAYDRDSLESFIKRGRELLNGDENV